MPMWTSIFFMDSNSPSMEFLLFFHDLVVILIIMLLINLFIIFLTMLMMNFFCYQFPESQSMEDFWLIMPILFLLFIGLPSIKNLYMCEELNDCDITIKIIGHQWYWSYELLENKFDSYLNKEILIFRLLNTFNHLILPIKVFIRMMVSSDDVIHSWSVPAIGIKMDAIPGRISNMIGMINRPGLLMGQCSEICGSNHSFMPIIISANSMKNLILYFNVNLFFF